MQEFLLITIVVVGFFILFFVFLFLYKKKKRKREESLDNMLDTMNFKRASINTSFLDKLFHNTMEAVVYSKYAQSIEHLPQQNITESLYLELEQNIRREQQHLKLQKTVHGFSVEKMKITKQENSSIHSVSYIETEGRFSLDYSYRHATIYKRAKKRFAQRFIFLNTNNSWLLEKVLPETDVVEVENT